MNEFKVRDYLTLVESQHKVRPRFMAVLTKYLEGAQAAYDAALEQPLLMSLDSAVGVQLDKIGEIAGVNRKYPYMNGTTTASMNDDQYRLVLRATIAKNSWDGSFKSYAETWNTIFGGQSVTAVVVDKSVLPVNEGRENMACEVRISGDFDADIAQLIREGYVFPKPMGVRMDFIISGQGDRTATATATAAAAVAFITYKISVTAQSLPQT